MRVLCGRKERVDGVHLGLREDWSVFLVDDSTPKSDTFPRSFHNGAASLCE